MDILMGFGNMATDINTPLATSGTPMHSHGCPNMASGGYTCHHSHPEGLPRQQSQGMSQRHRLRLHLGLDQQHGSQTSNWSPHSSSRKRTMDISMQVKGFGSKTPGRWWEKAHQLMSSPCKRGSNIEFF